MYILRPAIPCRHFQVVYSATSHIERPSHLDHLRAHLTPLGLARRSNRTYVISVKASFKILAVRFDIISRRETAGGEMKLLSD